MYFFLGLALGTLVFFILSLQISLHNQLASDRFRFRYFALRDELALMVMQGKISEDSWEYKNIVDAINFHINTVETMTIWRIVSRLASYHTSPEEDRKVKIIEKKIDSEDVKKLMFEFLLVTRDLLYRNSRAQIRLMEYFAPKNRKAGPPVVSRTVTTPKQAIDRIESKMHALRSSWPTESVPA